MGEAGVCLSVSCFRPRSEMQHQALGEAGHKWHSSQSCFHISFLTQKGICRPTTLVAFFFFFLILRDGVYRPSGEELTIRKWKQVVFVVHIGVKLGTYRILSYRLVLVYDAALESSHLLFFWSHMQCLSSRGQTSILICGPQQLARWDEERLSVVGWVRRCHFFLRRAAR